MGSWNETCAVSGLSIRSGEKIAFIALAQNPWNYEELTGLKGLKEDEEPPVYYKGSSGCYATDLWAPICLPIFGEYNDYGTIDNISSSEDELKQFVDAFSDCIPLDVGENEYHDVATGKLDIDSILELIREGRAYKECNSGHCNPTVPIGAIMVKKSVWDELLKVDLKKDTDMWLREIVTVETITNKLKTRYNKFKELKAKEVDSFSGLYELIEVLRDVIRNSFGNSPFRISDLANNENLLESIAKFEFFYIVIGHLRLSLSPTIGSGSQSDNRKLWKKINTKINKIIENENKLDKEDE